MDPVGARLSAHRILPQPPWKQTIALDQRDIYVDERDIYVDERGICLFHQVQWSVIYVCRTIKTTCMDRTHCTRRIAHLTNHEM